MSAELFIKKPVQSVGHTALAQLPQLAGHCNFLGSEIGRAGAWDVSAARLFSAAVRRRRQRSRIDARKWRM